MSDDTAEQKHRQRAPSQRSLATRARILDAAEAVFARQGFDGAAMRDIAAEAGEAVSLVHHHGVGKEALFRRTVARRADELAAARLAALAAAPPSVEGVLTAFVEPLATRADQDRGWGAYARLVAHVSADARWGDLAATHFDPTAERFIEAISATGCCRDRRTVAAGFVYSVSALLAHITAGWRIDALGGGRCADADAELRRLIAFCAAGFSAA